MSRGRCRNQDSGFYNVRDPIDPGRKFCRNSKSGLWPMKRPSVVAPNPKSWRSGQVVGRMPVVTKREMYPLA